MNKKCGIARDLMPLVIDDVAGSESREFVETHLAGCEECRAVYEQMQAELPVKSEQEKGSEQKAFSAAAGMLKKKRQFRILKYFLLGVLIAAMLIGGFSKLSQVTEPVYYGHYRVYLSELKSGDIAITMDYNGSYEELGATIESKTETDPETGEERNILYVWLEKHLIPRKMQTPMQNHPVITMAANDLSALSEIRQGVPGEYQTLWQPGTNIAKASEQMEEYFFWQGIDQQFTISAFWPEKLISFHADSGLNQAWQLVRQQKTAIFATVPEWQPWVGIETEPLDQETIDGLLNDLRNAHVRIDEPTPYEPELVP